MRYDIEIYYVGHGSASLHFDCEEPVIKDGVIYIQLEGGMIVLPLISVKRIQINERNEK